MNDKKRDDHGHWIGENDSEKCTHVLDAGGDDYENDLKGDNSLDFLAKYYIEKLGWTQEKAYNHIRDLINDGTIELIKGLNND